MPFPETPRIVYDKNPLREVVCQLRFPAILKIDVEPPAAFQDGIRKEFPILSPQEVRLEFPLGLERQIDPEALKTALPPTKNYQFASNDGLWKLNLTQSFIALTTSKYETREKFLDMLLVPLNTLLEIYAPVYFSRIGLRYIDVIQRSMLELTKADWGDLLQPYLLGILSESSVGGHVSNFQSIFEIALADNESTVRVVSGYQQADNGEQLYVIDSDFYVEGQRDQAATLEKLKFFGERGSRLFRWCITDRLHKAMKPRAI